MNKSLAILIALSFTAPAFAAETGSQSSMKIQSSESPSVENNDLAENFYQPKARQVVIALSPQDSYTAVKTSYIDYTGAYAVSAGGTNEQLIGIGVDVGLTDSVALLLSTNFGNSTSFGGSTEDSKSKGFSDINLTLNANSDLSAQDKLIYAFNFDFSPDKSKDSGRSRSGEQVDGNRFSGGSSYTPQIGYQHKTAENLILGTALAYTFRDPRSGISAWDGGANSVTGGNMTTLLGVIEKQFESLKIGGILTMNWSEKANYNGYSSGDPINYGGLSAYSNFLISKNFSLQPMISYMTITNRSVGQMTVDQFDATTVTVVAKMSL